MITGLPWYVPAIIVLVNAAFLTFWIVSLPPALRRAGVLRPGKVLAVVMSILLAWLALQAALAASGFYLESSAFPPRFLFGITPPLIAVAVLFAWKRSRQVLDEISLAPLTYVHSVRFFVELVVFALYMYAMTPRLMTFLGRNPDIVIGATAPLVGYLCITRRAFSLKAALVWHAFGLTLLANVSTLFIFSAPSPLQLFEVERPNVGFFYWPFIWAPTHGVPTVIFAHCIAIRTLTRALRRGQTGDVAGPRVTRSEAMPLEGRSR